MKSNECSLEVRTVTVHFGREEARVTALSDVSFTVGRGEFIAVMGPSGSGKSTLLHLLGGLLRPNRGEVFVGGELLSGLTDDALTLLRRRRIGFIFQAFYLVEVLSALENVALPLVLDGLDEAQAQKRASDALARVGLRERVDHRPNQLSGGERQRTAIARALVIEPAVVLADEPTGNLDSQNGEQVMALIRELVDERQHTVVMVTHDARSAALADRVLWLRDGAICEQHDLASRANQLLDDLELGS